MKTTFCKTIIPGLVIVISSFVSQAQTETANIYKYTPQPGFRKSKLDGKTEFYFKKDKKWVTIDLFDIKASYGNPAEDAQNDWNEIVMKNYAVKGDIVTENHEKDGWQITARTTITSIIKYNLSLITLTCPGGHASILLTNNDFNNVLDAEIGAFIGNLSFVSPAEAVGFIKPFVNNPVPPGENYPIQGFTQAPVNSGGNFMTPSGNYDPQVAPNPYHPPFPTPGEKPVKASIMMDTGWFVEATSEYIQYTKNDIKVIQYFYVAPEDPNSNSPDEDLFWRKCLNKYFSTDSYNKYPNDPYDFLTRLEFASCNAVYQPNGRQYFIAWLVDLHNTACSYLAITSGEQVYYSYFPHPNDLAAMNRFNNFPVDIQQIQGKWGDRNFAGAQMYEVNTGNYAGMSMASSANSYTFSGNSFSFLTKGATGMAGTAKAFQAEETGNFDVNGYNLVTNVASRTDQMTNTTTPKQERVEYSVAFKFARNTKVLFMQNKQYTSLTYNLVRIQ